MIPNLSSMFNDYDDEKRTIDIAFGKKFAEFLRMKFDAGEVSWGTDLTYEKNTIYFETDAGNWTVKGLMCEPHG